MTPTLIIHVLLPFSLGLLASIWCCRRFASSRTLNPQSEKADESSRVISSIFSLSAYLLESNDEHSVIRAAMRTGCELLDAEGSLFVPFDEYMQQLPVLEFGRTPSFASLNQDDRLTNPATRQKCKTCEVRQGGPDCGLIRLESSGYYNYCIPLRQNGRETGLFSFVFRAAPQVEAGNRRLLEESLRLVELALDTCHWRAQPPLSPVDPTPELESISPEAEARAILGERARVAREIHDGLAQTLAFLKIEIDRAEKLIEQGNSSQAASVLNASSRTLSDAFLDARQAIEDLRRFPSGDLAACLRQVGEDFEALSGLQVDLQLLNLPMLSANIQAQIIRIVQEALTNVRKHANASLVKISASKKDGAVYLEVQDNGPGFDAANPIAKARFGLRGMRERAEIIGAELEVDSRPGEGVSIRLCVPILEGAPK